MAVGDQSLRKIREGVPYFSSCSLCTAGLDPTFRLLVISGVPGCNMICREIAIGVIIGSYVWSPLRTSEGLVGAGWHRRCLDAGEGPFVLPRLCSTLP